MADTHTRGPVRSLPSSAWVYIETADHILHAGDVVEPGLLDELGSFAPLTVVMGNCDALDIRQRGATDVAELELEGVKLVMVHDAGAGRGRRQRLRARWPDARAVVFGHSHLPLSLIHI